MFMTLFANSKRTKNKKPFKVSDFFPFVQEAPVSNYDSIPKADITDLKFLFNREIDWDRKE